MSRESFYDQNLLLKDAGLVAASAAATVDSVAKTLNLGAGLVDISAGAKMYQCPPLNGGGMGG